MRACNNNNMLNPSIHLFNIMGLCIIACPHPLSCCIYTAFILSLAAYVLPSSPVLLHIYTSPHPLSCRIYTLLIPSLAYTIYTALIPQRAYILLSFPVLLHIYCTCFPTFWHCHPYILKHFTFTPFYIVQPNHTG